jgi:hypothetical protein
MITIDQEAREFARLPNSLDSFADRYKTTNKLYTFPSPTLWTIEKNLYFLLRNSIQKDFEPKYRYKPDYLSYDEYGNVTLAYLLMFVNGVPCLEDFDLSTVVVPKFSTIVDICRDNFPEKDVSEMEEVSW